MSEIEGTLTKGQWNFFTVCLGVIAGLNGVVQIAITGFAGLPGYEEILARLCVTIVIMVSFYLAVDLYGNRKLRHKDESRKKFMFLAVTIWMVLFCYACVEVMSLVIDFDSRVFVTVFSVSYVGFLAFWLSKFAWRYVEKK